jgi:hypothetical protein
LRRPQDKLSQRALVYELKHAIDRVMRRPWDSQAQQHLMRLIVENPHSVRASHVRYNIGRARREFLDGSPAPARVGLSPSSHDPRLVGNSLEV